jgi:hypothetical protein
MINEFALHFFPIPQLVLFISYIFVKWILVNPALIFKIIIYDRDVTLKDFFTLGAIEGSYSRTYSRDPGNAVTDFLNDDSGMGWLALFLLSIIYPFGFITLAAYAITNAFYVIQFLFWPLSYISKNLLKSENSFMNKTFLKRKKKKEF